MTSFAPYWGNLDRPPAVLATRQNSVRKDSMGNGSNAVNLQKDLPSVPQPRFEPQPGSRPNRISVQSQAPTMSTLSPLASPAESTFRPEGLAPRPPSYPYTAPEPYNKESLERRRKRASREKAQQQFEEYARSGPPPAAPDAPPQPPPFSYKPPTNGESALAQALARTLSARRPSSNTAEREQAESEDFSRGGPPMSANLYKAGRQPLNINTDVGRSNTTGKRVAAPSADDAERGIRRGSVQARKQRPEIRSAVDDLRQRRGSAATEGEAQRRREWAPDRSPLQRLELALDGITKEEKRARVEEAELLAREARAGRGGQNSVHFRNRPIAISKAEPQTSPEAGLVRNLSIKQQDEFKRSNTVEDEKPEPVNSATKLGKGLEYQPQAQGQSQPQAQGQVESSTREDEVKSGLQRGPSFRERAGAALAGVTAGALAGVTLKRSNSNKLKKAPPGDPWRLLREQAETQNKDVNAQSNPSVDSRQGQRNLSGGPLGSSPTDNRIGKQALDLKNGQAIPGRTSHPLDIAELMSDESLNAMRKRSNSSRKVEQLMGANVRPEFKRAISPQQQQLYADRLGRPEELGPVGLQHDRAEEVRMAKTVNGVEYAVPPAAAAENHDREQAAVDPDGHHYFSKVVHAGRDRRHPYRPGSGLYAPDERLVEWKKAGVASLTGPLLDVEANQTKQTEAEKDKAWWEAGNTGKRRPSVTKPVEAFDDGAKTNNGMLFSRFSSRLDDSPDLLHPVVLSRTRKQQEVFTVSRARIGFHKTSKNNNRIFLKKKPCPLPKRPSPIFDNDITLSSFHIPFLSSQGILSYADDCPEASQHNSFHPYHICSTSRSKPKEKKLTHSARSIRVGSIIVPTQFNPPLYLKCGPLLRYCGIRKEAVPQIPGQSKRPDKEIWRGTVMIVTQDSQSSYDTIPTLRLFCQPKSLLPPPPAEVDGGTDIPSEYVDPIAGQPKIGRDGRTLYVRPVEELEEEKDVSKDESDNGIFERLRSPVDSHPGIDGPVIDGEKLGKSVAVEGFRLYAERGVTFWRFNIEVELTGKQQRIAYRINQGPPTGFWVPAKGKSMNIMFHSCNGFSLSVNPDDFSGPDPMWRDVLNTHQTQPFHVMVGGGDQIYNDCVMKQTKIFSEWLTIKNPLHKYNTPFTREMQDELEEFYLNRYAMWFSQGLFGLANSQIPMVNIYDDHDIIDGYGSYPHHFMESPVFTGIGAIAFKYYMLFQHQSSIDEGEETEPSWLLGDRPGPYIKELSRSVFMSMGGGVAFLGMDCRTERTREDILTEETYDKILDRCHAELVKGETKHLIVLLGVPIAYPRLVWLENILTSRLMDPVKVLSRAGAFDKFLNKFDGGVEILDDLDDHWTAKNHKLERRFLLEDLQDLAAAKSVRITILSGDVHLAAIGQFYSHPKLGIRKDRDHRYMPNVISSAIVNTPPPDMMADVLNRRNRVHHLDEKTEEDMIPLFMEDVDGKKRNNKCLLPRRNWCSIREYNPELSPPPTPTNKHSANPPPLGLLRRLSTKRQDNSNRDPSPSRPGLLRRLSTKRQDSFPSTRVTDSRPPISNNGTGLLRRLSLSRGRPSADADRPAPPKRTLSLTRDFNPGSLFRRLSTRRKADSGGINGYGSETDDEEPAYEEPVYRGRDEGWRSGPRMRGGAGDERMLGGRDKGKQVVGYNDEPYYSFDESRSPSPSPMPKPRGVYAGRTQERPSQSYPNHNMAERGVAAEGGVVPVRGFHRAPTGLSEKAAKRGREVSEAEAINLEGGLDICINVEVSKKDPAGITTPYRLLVPALWYQGDAVKVEEKKEGVVKRWMSFGRGRREKVDGEREVESEDGDR